MARWVALLRGVNVGGGNKVPMAELRALAEGLGWTGVETYIASGNLIFSAPTGDHAQSLEEALAKAFGLSIPVCVLSVDDLATALDACPFKDGPGNAVHAFFCWSDPHIDSAMSDDLRAPDETLAQMGQTIWMHAPSGFGNSKLASKIDRVITGTVFTARNRNTVQKLVDIGRQGG